MPINPLYLPASINNANYTIYTSEVVNSFEPVFKDVVVNIMIVEQINESGIPRKIDTEAFDGETCTILIYINRYWNNNVLTAPLTPGELCERLDHALKKGEQLVKEWK